MKRIGIFGGTFNPVHFEHVAMAKEAIKELNLDKIIIIPTKFSPHKTLSPASDFDRLNMLRLAFSNAEKTEISSFEMDSEGKSYTYITVEHYKALYKDAELYFIAGGDMLVDFKTWKNPEKILSLCTLAVFLREDFYVDIQKEREYFKNKFGKDFILLSYVGKKDSSTKIRVKASLGLNIGDVCIESVAEYIEKNGVYKDKRYAEFLIKNLKESRRIHTAGVVECAYKKARELNLDANKVITAATLHDCAKYLKTEDYPEFKLDGDVPQPVVHAFLGAYIAEKVLKINDEDVINAIRYHTSGRAGMSTLEKLIFVADMIEEGRTYLGVDKLRSLYDKDFDECFKECLKEETLHLLNKKEPIYKETLSAYEYYIKENRI